MKVTLKFLIIFVVAGACMFSFSVSTLVAADYPNKPVTILVPYSPGGVSDTVARFVADTARNYFPQTFVVENRPGASGTRCIFELVKSKPDGYTLALGSSSEVCSALHVVPANYTPKDYTIICGVGTQPVTVSTAGPWNKLDDIVDYGKKNPGALRCGVSGMGGVTRLTGQQFVHKAGLDVKIVPFKGSGPLIPAVLGKHVEVGFLNVPETIAHYNAGTMKVLCVFGEKRSTALPNVPTATELGYPVAGGSTHFLIMPNGVDPSIRDMLHEVMKKVLKDKDFLKKTTDLGYSEFYRTPEEARVFLKDWYKTAGELFDSLGMKKKMKTSCQKLGDLSFLIPATTATLSIFYLIEVLKLRFRYF